MLPERLYLSGLYLFDFGFKLSDSGFYFSDLIFKSEKSGLYLFDSGFKLSNPDVKFVDLSAKLLYGADKRPNNSHHKPKQACDENDRSDCGNDESDCSYRRG